MRYPIIARKIVPLIEALTIISRDLSMRIDRQRLSVFGISSLPLIIGAMLAGMILTSNVLGTS
jgi:hypothetical protein